VELCRSATSSAGAPTTTCGDDRALRVRGDDEQLRLRAREVDAVDGGAEHAGQRSPIQGQDVHRVLAAGDSGRLLRFSFHGLHCSGRVRCTRG
jgi:hypothetical protein